MGRRDRGSGAVYQRCVETCPPAVPTLNPDTGKTTLVRPPHRCQGPWIACLDLGWVAGRRKRITRTGATKREARSLLDQMQTQAGGGIVPDTVTVAEWMTYWLEHVAPRGRSGAGLKPSTMAYYRRYTANWIIPMLGKIRLQRLTPRDVREMQAAMTKAGRSATTVAHAHAVLQVALRAAQADQIIDRNAASIEGGPAMASNPHKTLTESQARAVIEHATGDPRMLARVHVAVLGGLRQGEALALRWDDVHEAEGWLYVQWSAATVAKRRVLQRPKSAASTRRIPLAPASARSLSDWRRESGGAGYVFPGEGGPEAIERPDRDYRAWKAATAAVQVTDVPLHGARGTCATLLRGLGFSERMIADYLGQADVRVTMEHYLSSSADERLAGALALGSSIAAAV